MLSAVWDWVLPPRCGGCGALGAWLCRECGRGVRPLRGPFCRRCGRELESEREPCGCRKWMRALSGVRSAAVYDGPLQRALKRFKYDGWRALAGTLGGLLAGAAPDVRGELVVPVPLHRARAWARGYNQAELLARELCRRTGRARPRGRLVRTRNTRTQVGLDRIQRRRNVRAAFAWRGPALTGRSVLLVDDVTTTGATLEACAAALRTAGAARVTAVTVARALH